EQVRQDEPEWLLPEEGGAGVLEGDRRDQYFPSLFAIAPAQLPAFHVFETPFRCREMMAWADTKLTEVLLPKPEMQAQPKQKERPNRFRGRTRVPGLVRHAVQDLVSDLAVFRQRAVRLENAHDR